MCFGDYHFISNNTITIKTTRSSISLGSVWICVSETNTKDAEVVAGDFRLSDIPTPLKAHKAISLHHISRRHHYLNPAHPPQALFGISVSVMYGLDGSSGGLVVYSFILLVWLLFAFGVFSLTFAAQIDENNDIIEDREVDEYKYT